MKNKRWILHPKKSDNIVEQLLINRGIELKNKEDFLNPNYEKGIYDPFLFKDMKKVIKRIKEAIDKNEKIGIFTDYDADGIPGGALLYRALKKNKSEVEVYIPSREDGYGLNKIGIEYLKDSGCKLIITVDLGIAGKEMVEYTNKLGLDIIITDHHEIQEKLFPKDAFAIIHPNLPRQKYPTKNLAGGGVAWKLVQALYSETGKNDLKWLLDLAAISTITDIVPLIGENRVIAKYGLIVLSKTKNIGLQKLYEVAKIKTDDIQTYTVGFQIGPRINAPGRMDHATASFVLLTTENESEAKNLAQELNEVNLARQEELDRVLTEAREKIKKESLHKKKIILIEGKDWPSGIVGLVAGKLMDEFSRPVIVLGQDGDKLKGSGRSIDEFHLVEALEQCKKYLSTFGGHARAAGLSLENQHLSNLYDLLLEIAEVKLKDEDLIPKIDIDAEIKLEDINDNLYKELKKFEPHGLRNPRPVFMSKAVEIKDIRTVGTDGKHLKLKLTTLPTGRQVTGLPLTAFNAIGFDMGMMASELTLEDKIDIVFTIDENNWNDKKSLQLKLLDIRKGE